MNDKFTLSVQRDGGGVKSIIPLGGRIQTPDQRVTINFEVDGCSGSIDCAAWRGQHEIECLVRAGYSILAIEIHGEKFNGQ